MKSGEEHYKDYLDYLEKDDRQGLGLSLMASAFAGYAQGQGTLGRYYLLGQLFPKDLVNALKWLEKAAEQDYAPAMTALAAMYMFGDGVSQGRRKGRHGQRPAVLNRNLSGEGSKKYLTNGHAPPKI